MKENLKIETPSKKDHIEAVGLCKSLDLPCVLHDEDYLYACDFNPTIPCREITLTELRELARPKEYLNDKFELIVTNRPEDGWVEVPEGAFFLTWVDGILLFRDKESTKVCTPNNAWQPSMYRDIKSYFEGSYGEKKILWQRKENKVETEKKGRFLHQEWYEAFGRGEDVQFHPNNDTQWRDIRLNFHTMDLFDVASHDFRLKPKTIQIGARTIVKPISVKPEIGRTYFIVDLMNKLKYRTNVWRGTDLDIYQFNSGLCHLTAVDAIAMTDALLELMK